MKKELFLIAGSIFSAINLSAETLPDSIKQINLGEVVVSSVRAKGQSPIAYSDINITDIKKVNTAKNVPYILQTMPSVVAFSEDGSGVGNTSFRVRGTDATRINVTLNGMPLNNPESQEVYWVNIPDVSNSLQSIQLQRGVGTSTNGAASFGASLSMQTVNAKPKAYLDASSALGSYSTFINSVAFGTGILKNGLALDARYSKIDGDGYIRNGKVDHSSVYAGLSYYRDDEVIKLSYIKGIQHTGITWVGVSPDSMAVDRKYNKAGEYKDANGKNRYYDNETDNYYSDIVQFSRSKQISPNLIFNTSLSYNHGYGYYENYKKGEEFGGDFGLPNQIVDGVEHDESDVIRRKLMKNDFYVGSALLAYQKDKLNLTGGGMFNAYYGDHYGHLLWAKYNQNIPQNYEWYFNSSVKKEFNVFAKADYQLIDRLTVYGDIQYRYIDYRMRGLDEDFYEMNSKNYYSFINPKAGLSYKLNAGEVYGSLSIGNREPLRSDLKESVKGGNESIIKPERLFDYEFGYKYESQLFSFTSNFYYMNYNDQMVQTGKLNDVGYKLMENVDKSYRAGVELSAAYRPLEWLRADANLTLSQNKIKDYTVFYDLYDTQGDYGYVGQTSEDLGKTDISFSPDIVSSGVLTFTPIKDAEIMLIGKYVGKQYYDNTSDKSKQLDDYFVSNIAFGYSKQIRKFGTIEAQLFVNNILNKRYIANAWVATDKFQDNSEIVYTGYYPQATRNIMFKLGLKF